MKISGCVIARNEEANIAKCINSLKCVADEVIVVDTGSEDKTIQIAEELGAIVYKHKWENDFSEAKNAALDHASGDWIIFLDADEYFKEDSLPIIHTGYSSCLKESKAKRNLELLLANPEDEKSAYYLATTYYILYDYDNAIKYADRALSLESITRYDYLAYKMHLIKIRVAMTVQNSGNEKIQSLIEEAKQNYGAHPEIVAAEAAFLLREKHFGKALEKFKEALDCQEKYGKNFAQNDFPATVDENYYNIAQILYQMNREADALSFLVKTLSANKYHRNAFKSMLALFAGIPEKETIAFINGIYDIANEEDVKFIISQVAASGRPKITLYYADKWNNAFGHEDDVLIYAFLAQGNYQNALEIALLYLNSDRDAYSPLAASVIIMGRLFAEAKKHKADMGADYFEIVQCYAEGKQYSRNVNAYLSVLSILAKYIGQYNLSDYLKIGSGFALNHVWDVAELFLADYRHEQAIHYFNMLFESENSRDRKAIAAFKAGYCFYKLKQFHESLSWFKRAIDNRYADNDIAEFLQWIVNQSSDKTTKSNAGALVNSIHEIIKSKLKLQND